MDLYLLFHIFCCLAISIAAAGVNEMKSKCQTQCGNVNIPYPFGIGHPSCYKNQHFKITCNYSITPPKPFLGELEILNISLLGQMSVSSRIGWDCNTQLELGNYSSHEPYEINLDERGPYSLSRTRNKIIVIGCDTVASITGTLGTHFTINCSSTNCKEKAGAINGSCTGIGCCQHRLLGGLKRIHIDLQSVKNHTDGRNINPCSYSFLAEKDRFVFTALDLEGINFFNRSKTVPLVLDWVVGDDSCEEAQVKETTYGCLSENSRCYDIGLGHRCNCSSGFQGNPYIRGGCQDIDECQDRSHSPCRGICINTVGSYNCICPKGTSGNPYKRGKSCTEDPKEFPMLKIFLGISISFLFLLIGGTWTYRVWRKREMIKLKEKFFQQNGGLLLQQKISSRRNESLRIFTAKELESATENYSDSRVVGQGGYGIVYKGTLPDNKIVAIKKSKMVDTSQIEQFINEVDILSQINHRNVVKLLGCCLEDQVPLLVYEFVSNGTLYSHIHDTGHMRPISLQDRLRIATETADALAYLHSAASTPIIHRDVKSTNILLDDNLTAKVSDFGASRLVPIDQTQITTLVQGTLGYLDPEYFESGQLTAKSDVYSFGVVLAELLTAEKPVCISKSQKERNLAMHFVSAMKENCLLQVLEDQVLGEGPEALLIAVAQLARRCLKHKGEERPTMKEVVMELQGLRGFEDHPRASNNIEKPESLLGETSQGCIGEASGEYSLKNHFISTFGDGR